MTIIKHHTKTIKKVFDHLTSQENEICEQELQIYSFTFSQLFGLNFTRILFHQSDLTAMFVLRFYYKTI